ncbi:Ornithine carbamoyltransferase [Planctomycetes bacterium Pan216]|uniref:Ornithine carbamoyltransferase n=1 Tax=Kolteria novifilia TaxID=2527975 RepID=A0A518BAP5_9BACT|nr:Ornithine carbamoyltransferase [Planctomycetes bacterium Pan216]
MRHLLSLLDLSRDEVHHLLELALQLKQQQKKGIPHVRLGGRVLGMVFEKPSLRTRVSFESAMAHLGGSSIFLTGQDVGLGKRESIADVGRIMSTYVDLLAVRTYSHDVLEALSQHASCPVINALSDFLHPCQALADMCTLQEHFGRLDGLTLAFIGDGNNVARSLAFASSLCDVEFVLSSPEGYSFEPEFKAHLQASGMASRIRYEPDPLKAVEGVDAVYTDVWASMGQEEEREQRLKTFRPYQVDSKMMGQAKPGATFLHCLPAHRGEEVTAEVIDGHQSIVVEQAANRMHAQKALMLWLLTEAS